MSWAGFVSVDKKPLFDGAMLRPALLLGHGKDGCIMKKPKIVTEVLLVGLLLCDLVGCSMTFYGLREMPEQQPRPAAKPVAAKSPKKPGEAKHKEILMATRALEAPPMIAAAPAQPLDQTPAPVLPLDRVPAAPTSLPDQAPLKARPPDQTPAPVRHRVSVFTSARRRVTLLRLSVHANSLTCRLPRDKLTCTGCKPPPRRPGCGPHAESPRS